ncbi:hypothetical protein SAMN05216276_10715 [Streptosporangium subroseum]|uniref:Uncharacterized protein n=1 Tax=Streptosporangium subroseum TaxID=106412 RepID=A0A239NVD3_9ACTN|nr:hypothetical protein [Streptosporangium subroseum]SNT58795.1 hypothetical protein SAMN05216276_10715 [Streptosporangium subroseum]
MNPIMQAAAAQLHDQQQQDNALALTLLREALVRLSVRSELRDNDSALMITGRGAALPLWVFVGYGGNDFSWQSAEKRHPVNDVAGAAQALADYIGR